MEDSSTSWLRGGGGGGANRWLRQTGGFRQTQGCEQGRGPGGLEEALGGFRSNNRAWNGRLHEDNLQENWHYTDAPKVGNNAYTHRRGNKGDNRGGRGRGNAKRGRGNNNKAGRGDRDNWTCQKCKGDNYPHRTSCFKCGESKDENACGQESYDTSKEQQDFGGEKMAEGGTVDCFRKVLECSICLDLFDDPKMLNCSHEFCKRCLEDILTFRNDGSAIITCPLRCGKETILNDEQTVHDLPASYTTKNMLDTLHIHDPDSMLSDAQRICRVKENCAKRISVFCCKNIMCQSCYNNHITCCDKATKHQMSNLSFNRQENKLMAFCDRHSTDCSKLCVDGKFLCLYCLQRDADHKGHTKNPIDTEVKVLKEALNNKVYALKEAEEHVINEVYSAQQQLKLVLEQRKKECMLQYESLLEEEEKRLIEEMASIVDAFIKGSEKCSKSSNAVLQPLENLQKRFDIEIVLRKKEILNIIDENKNIAREFIHVSLIETSDFLSSQPYGKICHKKGSPKAINEGPHFLFSILKENIPAELSEKSEEEEFTYSHSNCEQIKNMKEKKALGDCFFFQSQYDKALASYTEAIELYPDTNTSLLSQLFQNRGAAKEKLHNWTGVVEDCAMALLLNPLYTKAMHRRSNAYKQLGEIGKAYEDKVLANHIEKECNVLSEDKNFSTLDRSDDRLLDTLSSKLAKKAYRNEKSSFLSVDVVLQYFSRFNYDVFTIPLGETEDDTNYSSILRNMKICEYNKVVELCEREITSSGKHKERARLLRGTLRLLMQDDMALADLFEVSHSVPTEENMLLRLDSHLKIADVRFYSGDIDGSFEALDCALQIDKYNATVYSCKGRLLDELGKYDEARVNLKKAVHLDAAFVEPMISIFDLDAKSGDVSNVEMKGWLLKLIERSPYSCEVYDKFGSGFLMCGKMEEAKKCYDKAILFETRNPRLYVGKGRCNASHPEEAEKWFLKAMEVDKNDGWAYILFGTSKSCKNNRAAGMEYLHKGIHLLSFDPRVLRRTKQMKLAYRYLKGAEATQKALEYYLQHQSANTQANASP